MNQRLIDHEMDALWSADDLDAMIDEALESLPGGRSGSVRTAISPWPSLLNRTISSPSESNSFPGSPHHSQKPQ